MAPPQLFHEQQRLQMCLKHTLNNLFQYEAFRPEDLNRIADQLTPPDLLGFSPHRTPLLGAHDVNVLEVALGQHSKTLHWLPSTLKRRPRHGASVEADSERPTGTQPGQQQEAQGASLGLSGSDPAPNACAAHLEPEAPPRAAAVPRDAAPQAVTLPAEVPGNEEPGRRDSGASGGGSGVDEEQLTRPDLFGVVLNVHQPPASAPLRWLSALASGVGLGSGGRHWLGLRPFDGVWFNLDSQLAAPEPLGDVDAVCAFLQRAVAERDAKVLLVVASEPHTEPARAAGTHVSA